MFHSGAGMVGGGVGGGGEGMPCCFLYVFCRQTPPQFKPVIQTSKDFQKMICKPYIFINISYMNVYFSTIAQMLCLSSVPTVAYFLPMFLF